jgi:hypothetical protein
MAYQAIETKYLPATNFKGSRVKAWCEAGSVTLNWAHELNVEPNHRRAAEALRAKYGWTGPFYGKLVSGALPKRGYVFVFTGAREG